MTRCDVLALILNGMATPEWDVAVLGDEPAGYFAAALLRASGIKRVVHVAPAGDASTDRLTLLNPALFDLHTVLHPLRDALKHTACSMFQLLGDKRTQANRYNAPEPLAWVVSWNECRQLMRQLAEQQGVHLRRAPSIQVANADESAIRLRVGDDTLAARCLVMAGGLTDHGGAVLAIEPPAASTVHRRTTLRGPLASASSSATLSLSLDLHDHLYQGIFMQHDGVAEASVLQPVESVRDIAPVSLLAHWLKVLHGHGVIDNAAALGNGPAVQDDLPLMGALFQEGVVNRTVLIGSAGGFFSTIGEAIYPGCWSALYAVKVVKAALKEPHLQDALNEYRLNWRTTLGEYLRGPQQNLRLLLPLAYRNAPMTQRLAESILLGKDIVR